MKVNAIVDITTEKIIVDGKTVISGPDLLRSAYLSLKMDYPKFYKMDQLSKLGLLSVEYLMKIKGVDEKYGDDEIAVLFNNRDASACSDIEHLRAISNGIPSPSVFVYTLPNIVLGEIAIRNKWFGEQLCTVTNSPNYALLYQQCSALMHKGSTKAIILLIVNSLENTFDACTVLIEKDGSVTGIPFTPKELERIIKKHARAKT